MQKQRINVYTMMLILSFFALVISCVLLWLELSSYNEGKYPYWDTSAARTTSWLMPAGHLADATLAGRG
ncbi:MAG: hypothetical protein J5I93_22245 [Pirellulaceae bacterium]|nr:hypothetical protein [Pirellulaceae bacterium]